MLAEPYSRRPGRFVYELTDAGRGLAGPLRLLTQWGARQTGGATAVQKLGFGPDGRTLTTVSSDGVRTWDTTSRTLIGPPVYAEKVGGPVEFGPDGRFLAVERAGSVLFWDVTGRRETGPRVHGTVHSPLGGSGKTRHVRGELYEPSPTPTIRLVAVISCADVVAARRPAHRRT